MEEEKNIYHELLLLLEEVENYIICRMNDEEGFDPAAGGFQCARPTSGLDSSGLQLSLLPRLTMGPRAVPAEKN